MNYETSMLSNNGLESKKYFAASSNGVNHLATKNVEDEIQATDSSTKSMSVGAEETRELLRQYLERSLLQSAKSSIIQSEGYHHLKQDGKLAYYQRQQSRPEQGVLVRRGSNPSNFDQTDSAEDCAKLSCHEIPKAPVSEELHDFPTIKNNVKQYRGRKDGKQRSFKALEPLKSEKKTQDNAAQSSDSLSSDEDSKRHLRSKSFSRAIGRKSVISFIESKEKDVETSVPRDSRSLPQSSLEKHAQHETSSSRPDVSMAGDSLQRHRHVTDDVKASTIEKKNSFSGRLKKVMASTSNKKKLKYKKSFEMSNLEEQAMHSYRGRSPKEVRAHGGEAATEAAPTRTSVERDETDGTSRSVSVTRHSSSLKRKPIPSDESESSVSPPKSKLSFPPRQFFRSISNRSPKAKRRLSVEQRPTSSSLNALNGLELKSTDGSRSLPHSERYGAAQVGYGKKSTDSVKERNKVTPPPDASHNRPDHLDLNGKKKSKGKFKRFVRSIWKRNPKPSDSAQLHSHPSVPLDAERRDKNAAKEAKPVKAPVERADPGGGDAGVDSHKPYHHRGSLSFSPGDKLDTEKRKVFERFVETLNRVSSHYSHHKSYCSNSGSRINTPGSFHSSTESKLCEEACKTEFKSDHRAGSSSPPSSHFSDVSAKYPSSVHSSTKAFRQFKDGSRPALAAFHNIRNQQMNLDESRGAKKRSILRRHTHHTHAVWAGVRCHNERHRVMETPPPGGADQTMDVVDGIPSSSVVADGYVSRQTSSGSDEVDMAEELVGQPIRVEHESEVDSFMPSPSLADYLARPSTSRGHDGANGFLPTPTRDVDELVREIARCIRSQGDVYNTSVDTPDIPMGPLRDHMLQYLRDQTYARFRGFAQLFFTHLDDVPAARNPDALSFVVAWNMSRFICNLFTGSDGGMFNHIVKHSTQFVVDMMDNSTTPLSIITAQLQATEEVISQCESSSESPFEHHYFYEVD